MADFDLTVTSGASLQPWVDERNNPRAGYPHLRWQGVVGTQIEVSARLQDGSAAPADGALGGRLFTYWVAEYPTAVPGLIPTGSTSVVRFTPVEAGHYLVGCRRPGGGKCLLHIDVAEAS